jgi:hypothetical protein
MTSSCFTTNYIVTPEPWDTPALAAHRSSWRFAAATAILVRPAYESGAVAVSGWRDHPLPEPPGAQGTPAGGPTGVLAGGPAGTPSGGPVGVLTGGPAGTSAGGPLGVLSGGPAGTSSGGPTGVLAGGPAGRLSGGPAGTLSGTPGDALAVNTSVDVVSWHPERSSACAAASSARGDGTTPALGSAASAGVPAKTGGPVQPSSSRTLLSTGVSSSGQLAARQMANANASSCRFAACSAFVPPFRNLTGERWRTRARKFVHLRGVLGSCRVATDRSRRDNVGGRKGQCPDTRRRDNCDTMVTTTSEQQADTSCNIAVIHAQLHRPNRLRGYGPSGSRPSAARLIGARVAALLIAGPRASRTATTCC